ncbi:hypothetical protein [Cupriavidus consociatus]|uniref:hypothetical protein n=1 Tax=Cupriavidus consociatus TaxID=2821357 RepID=UPI001AE2E9F2|nr:MULTISPECIES: hypothetical protein [unclassified Cupriavidus]MBP0624027.1 hypothetical protein [Cupriavidus sp. LEh25]MDK2660737.1 hypothetical protein [Cupriavidus sp. LEh21]
MLAQLVSRKIAPSTPRLCKTPTVACRCIVGAALCDIAGDRCLARGLRKKAANRLAVGTITMDWIGKNMMRSAHGAICERMNAGDGL